MPWGKATEIEWFSVIMFGLPCFMLLLHISLVMKSLGCLLLLLKIDFFKNEIEE